ncbi:alpha/beta family hydrolase [Mucilaginibacter ximonensis]|uniref:Alpha/beta family hydrolase n=1 Tax=Mucilaginibacter ximonensis TaxID=538021 RepID=A0ABW5YD30_9SPHI
MRKPNTKNILLVVQRDNFKKDIPFLSGLTDEFKRLGYEIHLHKPVALGLRSMLDSKGRFYKLPFPLRFLCKTFVFITKPSLWKRCFKRQWSESLLIADRCRRLKKHISRFGSNVNLIVLARSAGARVSSLIANETNINKLICLGYPFKHPEKPAEIERYQHLPFIKVPFLIIQGTDDVYGGSEIESLYHFAPNTSIKFIEASHEFKITRDQLSIVLYYINDFISVEKMESVYP